MKTGRALALASSRKVRVELFFSSANELRDRIGFLHTKGVSSFNLVNKSNKDDLLQSVDVIRSELQDASVCAHYSLKYNKSRKLDGAYHNLQEFVVQMNALGAHNEMLIVTGSGPKGKFDSLTALQRLQKESIDVSTCMAVAFNPFFPDEKEYEEEKTRLLQKLDTGIVSKVYLQFGTNLKRLRTALQYLTDLQATHPRRFEVCGSVFLPTKKLIAQQKFRPWNGVFLCDEFLASEDGARGIVLQILRLYKEFGSEILIEAPGVRNEKDWSVVESLLAERDRMMSSNDNKDEVGGAKVTAASASKRDGTSSKRRKVEQPTKKSAGIVSVKSIPSSTIAATSLKKPGIVLFHSHDVRLHDNLALQMASHHEQVIPVFLWSKAEQGEWGVTGCLEVVLKDALRHLGEKLKQHDLQLICREGDDSSELLQQICNEVGAGAVYWNKEHTPESRKREEKYRTVLDEMNIEYAESQSSLLYDPQSPSLSTGFHGGHWGTLMPFLKGCQKQLGEPRTPISRADTFYLLDCMRGPDTWPKSSSPIDELNLAVIGGKDKWDEPVLKRFPMSEEDALTSLDDFFSNGFEKYERERSRADIEGATSRLSAHLRIGTISPNELYHRTERSSLEYNDRKTFSRRLFWRDLAYYHLANFPEMRSKSIRLHYEETEWCSKEEEEKRFNAWKSGQTGFPIVDAGMRELWEVGWMTQSVRMVCASFLVEYLRVNWVKGCEWFHYTLVDADSAINPMMWQNAGRSGIDQWNFVLSPVTASQDATGEYTRKWVPELAKLPKGVLHKPWEAPALVLDAAGVVLGETYPKRIVVDLKAERAKSVESVLEMRRQNQQFNSDRGYDLITLPNGKQTVVFTKKEFRIDRDGVVVKEAPRSSKKSSWSGGRSSGRGRRGKAQQKKELRRKAAQK